MANNHLQKYAELAVKIGANVQKEQMVVIQGAVDAALLVRMISTESYKAGAGRVFVEWTDGEVTRDFYLFSSDEELKKVPKWTIDKLDYFMDNGACFIHVSSPIVGVNKDVNPDQLQTFQKAMEPHMRKRREYTMANHGQWTIVAYPNVVWAKKVFPYLDDEKAYDELMKMLLYVSRVDEDPINNWNLHNAELKKHNQTLTDFNFKSLHFKNSLGTDLVVGLADDHIWNGGQDVTTKGISFNPNIPTEETFTMPHKFHVDGKVVATKPLDFDGKLIEDFSFVFKDGKVLEYDAKTEKELLGQLLNYDEGASHIGEVALVPHDSPISNSNILFYNTLLDENAACHLALGKAYPNCIRNSLDLSQEELNKRGYNHSMIHIDFMFGSSDMEITGLTQSGKKIKIFEKGNFVI